MKLIAEKAFSYPFLGGKALQPGDEFEAADEYAAMLVGGKLAKAAPSKRKYERRDMVAEGK